MQITVINNNPASSDGSNTVPLPDSTSVKPGEQKTMAGRTQAEAQLLISGYQSDTVIIRTALEAIDRAPIVATMKADATPGGGVGTAAAIGANLESQDGTSENVQAQMYLGCFDDVACSVPAINATLDTAAAGTIDSGGGTNLLKMTPSVTGETSVTMTNAEDEVVYVKQWPVGADYTVDSSGVQSATFIP